MAADRARRGVVLAEIGRQVLERGLPAPAEIRFDDEFLFLDFDCSGEVDAWARLLDAEPEVGVSEAADGTPTSWQYRARRRDLWHGCYVRLLVCHLLPTGDELVVGGPAAGQDGGAR